MIDYLELNRIAEEIRQNCQHVAVAWALVDVYEKGKDFYDTPRCIIRASIPTRYLQRYKKCFDNNYTIVINKYVTINDVRAFLG